MSASLNLMCHVHRKLSGTQYSKNGLKGSSETWVEVMRKKNILIKIHQPGYSTKNKCSVLTPAAAFEVLFFYSNDNELEQHTHFSKTF